MLYRLKIRTDLEHYIWYLLSFLQIGSFNEVIKEICKMSITLALLATIGYYIPLSWPPVHWVLYVEDIGQASALQYLHSNLWCAKAHRRYGCQGQHGKQCGVELSGMMSMHACEKKWIKNRWIMKWQWKSWWMLSWQHVHNITRRFHKHPVIWNTENVHNMYSTHPKLPLIIHQLSVNY